MEMLARLANLPGALPGACAQGLIWGIMAIGVYLTYRILDVADLTVDGSFGTGGAVCVMCLLSGQNIWVSLLATIFSFLPLPDYERKSKKIISISQISKLVLYEIPFSMYQMTKRVYHKSMTRPHFSCQHHSFFNHSIIIFLLMI